MMAALAEMAAQAALAVMAALAEMAEMAALAGLAVMAASEMAAIRLSAQGVAAGVEEGKSAWLADQAVLPARGAALQVRR
jgi:hypothetical protein